MDAAFNAAPVANSDGVPGINLHVQVDEAMFLGGLSGIILYGRRKLAAKA